MLSDRKLMQLESVDVFIAVSECLFVCAWKRFWALVRTHVRTRDTFSERPDKYRKKCVKI